MPVYHFNLADHLIERDIVGTELASPMVARVEAIRFAGAYLADHPELMDDGRRFEVWVTDDADRPVYTVSITARDGA
jgi:hypothetical protein